MSRTTRCLASGLLAALLARNGAALAFPFVDPSNRDSLPTTAPQGTELPATDVRGLGNQLKLVNPAPAGNPSAWTILPRMTVQELFTDNALEVSSPRRFDAITILAPGISVQANTPRLQLNLDYQPTLLLHAINGPLNTLAQQLSATGIVTIVPDLAFVDVRAASGVHSRYGGVGLNGGAIGNANNALGAVGTGVGGVGAAPPPGQGGTNPRALIQTVTVGMSPYLLHQFKDYGTGKIGVSIDASRSSTIDGFFASPLLNPGRNAQTYVTTEEFAQYTTGEFLGRVQNTISADFSQSQSRATTGSTIPVITLDGATGATVSSVPAQSFSSRQYYIKDEVSYAVNRYLSVQASIGEQQYTYSNNAAPHISGLTWTVGFTFTPSPLSSLSVAYGHYNGSNNFNVNGYIAIGGRTQLSISYTDTIGTQLQNLQNQFNNSTVNANGQLVNATTGGQAFPGTNAFGLQNGVFRFDTLSATLSTGWLRDTVQFNLVWTIQTNLTPGSVESGQFFDPTTGQIFIINQPVAGTNQSSDSKMASLTWTHELSPDLTMSASASYNLVRRPGNLGTDTSLATAVALQYALSASTTVSGRYSFFDRSSKIPGYSLYENLLLLGFTKQF